MFHSQLGTRNEMFLFCTRVNILCLSCENAVPLTVNRNTKTRNSQYQRNVPFQISEQLTKLKISDKTRQRLKEKLRIEYVKRLGEMEAIFKIWRSLFRSKAAERAMIKFWEMKKMTIRETQRQIDRHNVMNRQRAYRRSICLNNCPWDCLTEFIMQTTYIKISSKKIQ